MTPPTLRVASGSPPPTRGARTQALSAAAVFRITPAYAGSTASSSAYSSFMPDHPRLRGEHAESFRTGSTRLGSPPPTRGARGVGSGMRSWRRITPAYAGSTGVVRVSIVACPDHPRLRGEHPAQKSCRLFPGGSPPPTRGARSDADHHLAFGRITPAYAGSTTSKTVNVYVTGDHPRLRGEHQKSEPESVHEPGSPPPTRGARP